MTDSRPTALVEHATFIIELHLDAAPSQVFTAFSDPTAHDRWFAKGSGWPIADYSHDSGSAGVSMVVSAQTAQR